jgi:Zn-dependent peptidase ImmA (M78 family)
MAGVRPEPIRASKASIWTYAERLAVALKFAPGDSMDLLIARLGGKIRYKNASTSEALPESMVVNSTKDFIIYLPSMTSAARDRFTIAHELGHLFLHFPRVAREQPGKQMVATRWVDENDEAQQRAEWEANWFAAAFLMPKEQFSAAYSEETIAHVADIFGVSEKAVEVRAKSLGLAVG